MKLPAFYVLDAISKNVFDPYAAKFSAFVVALFLDTYSQVDQTTRSKMEEMLVTWRTGSPSGKELFGIAVQVSLERQIWGNDSASVIDNVSAQYTYLYVPYTDSRLSEAIAPTWASASLDQISSTRGTRCYTCSQRAGQQCQSL